VTLSSFVLKIASIIRGRQDSTIQRGKLKYRDADKSLARPGRKQATTTEDFGVSYILFIITIGGILLLFIYITRLASNKIF